jgi:hypothetical protein
LAQPDWLVCAHEAGHIAAAFLRGGTITAVSVEPNDERLGEVVAEFYPKDWRSVTVYCMAGFWAQHHIAECHYPWDYARIDKILWEEILRENRATKGAEQRCFRTAEELVLDNRELILAVAKALQQGQDKDWICRFLLDTYPKESNGRYKARARRRH